MMEKLREKIESMFEVRRTNYTGKRIFFTFILIILMASSFPIYFRYEEWAHEKYAHDYGRVKTWVEGYKEENGQYPLGKQVSLENEQHLRAFFEENHLNPNRRLYYVNADSVPELGQLKYTYLIDADHGTLFTAEYVIFNMRRMHLPGN